MIGYGEAARHKPVSIAEADEWWADLVTHTEVITELDGPPLGSGLVAFGNFVFDPENSEGQSDLIVPEVLIGRRNGRCWLTQIGRGADRLAGRSGDSGRRRPVRSSSPTGGLTEQAWQGAWPKPYAGSAGATSTRWCSPAMWWPGPRTTSTCAGWPVGWPTAIPSAGPIWSTAWSAPLRRCWSSGRRAWHRSRVLAGTIRRSGHDDHDLNLAAALCRSSKDLEEHEYAVRSVAAALSPFCSDMEIPETPYVLVLPNLLHLATDVTAAAVRGSQSRWLWRRRCTPVPRSAAPRPIRPAR